MGDESALLRRVEWYGWVFTGLLTIGAMMARYPLVASGCAIGGVLNEHTIPRLRCRIVAGGANNQLATPADGRRLLERGILYAPDYVINSAAPYAVIGAGELRYSPERLDVSVQGVAEALLLIFRRARAEGAPTAEVADRIAEERIASAAHLRAMAPGTGAVPRA